MMNVRKPIVTPVDLHMPGRPTYQTKTTRNSTKVPGQKTTGRKFGKLVLVSFCLATFPLIKIYISHLRWLPSPTPKLPREAQRLDGKPTNAKTQSVRCNDPNPSQNLETIVAHPKGHARQTIRRKL